VNQSDAFESLVYQFVIDFFLKSYSGLRAGFQIQLGREQRAIQEQEAFHDRHSHGLGGLLQPPLALLVEVSHHLTERQNR
jgi:hypothetical protein